MFRLFTISVTILLSLHYVINKFVAKNICALFLISSYEPSVPPLCQEVIS